MLFTNLLDKTKYTGTPLPIEVDHITSDSRETRSGSVFVCVKGFATDGHLFALRAYENGCRAFVCERTPDLLPSDASIIIVENSRRELARLSSRLYGDPSKELTVIGITGTKGKTTTALMINQLLDLAGIPCGYIGSNGISFGSQSIESANTTPESYKLQAYMRMMVDSGIKALAIEISSQALKLERTLGIDVDIAHAIADKLNRKLVIEDMEFDSIVTAVQGGKAHIGAAGMTVTEERKKNIELFLSDMFEITSYITTLDDIELLKFYME